MVEELKSQTREVLESLTDEQVQMVLAYARQVRDMEPAVLNNILERLLEDSA
jgi:flagellar motor switch protein FliG